MFRSGSDVNDVQYSGYYWSATEIDSYSAFYLDFYSGVAGMGDNGRYSGRSVRLVKDL